MYYLLQISIVFALMASNIHWQCTPNGYLAGLVGTGLAYVSTVAVNQSLLWSRKMLRSAQRDALR
jgi:hypothetical protein